MDSLPPRIPSCGSRVCCGRWQTTPGPAPPSLPTHAPGPSGAAWRRRDSGSRRAWDSGRSARCSGASFAGTTQPPARALLRRAAIVVGGGLAGTSAARSLAQRGWQVQLIERHSQLAAEASGNPQGILYARLSAARDPVEPDRARWLPIQPADPAQPAAVRWRGVVGCAGPAPRLRRAGNGAAGEAAGTRAARRTAASGRAPTRRPAWRVFRCRSADSCFPPAAGCTRRRSVVRWPIIRTSPFARGFACCRWSAALRVGAS